MKGRKLGPSELKFIEIIWKYEPVKSGELARISLGELGWQRTTVYTVIKKLIDCGYVKNERSIVSTMIDRKTYYHNLAADCVDEYFGGDLGNFIAAYHNGVPMTRDNLIDYYDKVKNYKYK